MSSKTVSRGFIPEVESLRGIAITLVFLLHSTLGQLGTSGVPVSPLRALVCGGFTGVSLFFVLSGFLLAPPFLTEAAGGQKVNRGAYFMRRALRILPLYWTAVMVAAMLSARRPTDLLRAIPYLFFLQGVPGATSPLRPYNGVWWSLSTEVQFYALLPLLPLCWRSRRIRPWAAVAAGVYLALYALIAAGVLLPRTTPGLDRLQLSVFGRAPLFAFGIAAAWLYGTHGQRLHRWSGGVACLRWGGADLLMFAAVFALARLLQRVVLLGYFDAELVWVQWHIVEGALWTAVLLLMLLAPLRLKPLLSNRGWQLIGLLSYSIYLWHYPLIVRFLQSRNASGAMTVIGWSSPALLALPFVMALCLGLSWLSYRFIERPFLRRKAHGVRWLADIVAVARGKLRLRQL